MKLNCQECGNEINGRGKKFCSKVCEGLGRIRLTWKLLEQGLIKDPRTVRARFLEYYGNVCQICGLKEWMEQPIPLVLDHIDGNSDNWMPDNLRLICCNCDAQTPTYKAKNLGNGRAKRRERYAAGMSY